jgi:hypothetical protein
LESVQRTTGKYASRKIFSIVVFIVVAISNLWAIPYSSEASTLRVTLLHFIKDQCIILALSVLSASAMTKLICDK